MDRRCDASPVEGVEVQSRYIGCHGDVRGNTVASNSSHDTWTLCIHRLLLAEMKLKQRLSAVLLGSCCLMCTILLILDLYMSSQTSENVIFEVPLHQRRFLDHRKIEVNSEVNHAITAKITPGESSEVEDFADLLRYVTPRKVKGIESRRKPFNPSIGELLGIARRQNLTNWERFHLDITQNELYKKEDDNIDNLIRDMIGMNIVHVEQKEGGTQLKLIIDYENGGKALFKPMRFSREKETDPNHFYFVDFERHNSEIAAYHLDRLLGFRRAPPVVGRILNMTSEIYALSEYELIKTFFISPANNLCFHGRCGYYCDTGHAVCGHPDMLEGSFAAFLPPKTLAARKAWRHPWRRSYHKRRKASWELNNDYCKNVIKSPPYDEGRRMADLMDMAVLDFLIGNMDRHHYETFKIFGNNTFTLHLDHGRGFGKPYHDEMSILAPIYQCCIIRQSTLKRLLELYLGPERLSDLLRTSLKNDPVDPVLTEPHLLALDRRLRIILDIIRECLQDKRPDDVIIYDIA